MAFALAGFFPAKKFLSMFGSFSVFLFLNLIGIASLKKSLIAHGPTQRPDMSESSGILSFLRVLKTVDVGCLAAQSEMFYEVDLSA